MLEQSILTWCNDLFWYIYEVRARVRLGRIWLRSRVRTATG